MIINVDQQTGRLRFDAAGFDALYALATRGETATEATAALHDAGISDGYSVDPLIEPSLHAMAHPVAEAQLSIFDHRGTTWSGRIWISTEAAAYVLSASDMLDELITTGPGFFPASVARIVGLGPRKHATFTGWSMPKDHLEHLISATESERQRIAETIQHVDDDTNAFISGIVEGPWQHWMLNVAWDSARDSESERSLHIFDAAGAIALLGRTGGDVSFEPITPTEVWSALTTILPYDDELAPAL